MSWLEGMTNYTLTSGMEWFTSKGTGWRSHSDCMEQDGNVMTRETLLSTKKQVYVKQKTMFRLGDIYPDFTMGINNSLSYKGFNLSFLIDIRQGGSLYSGTVSSLRSLGLSAETAVGREDQYIESGVIMNADGTSRPNDVPVKNMQDY